MKFASRRTPHTATPVRASTYAALNNVTSRTVYRWIHSGKLKARQIDGVWFV